MAHLNLSSSIMLGGLGIVLAGTLSAAAPAQARPLHHQMRSTHHSVVGAAHYRSQRHVASRRRFRSAAVGASTRSVGGNSRPALSGGSDIVAEARHWLGGNPTHRRSLWCAAFMNFILERTGRHGTGSDLARSFASYGHRVSGPRVGAIAVMSRRGGGHVGVVSGIDASGNPIIISGNNGNRVREAAYRGGRIFAYVVP